MQFISGAPKSVPIPVMLAAIVMVASSCDQPPDETESATRTLNGTVDWPDYFELAHCDFLEQQKIRNALTGAATIVRELPGQMTECLKDAIMSFEQWSVN